MTDIILPSKEDKEHIDNLVSSLFTQAKEKDAAEYIASVKYFFDMTSLHLKSPNDELGETINQVFELTQSTITGNFSFKLFSYLYVQIFESENWLDLLFNLLSIINGQCCNRKPFKKIITSENKLNARMKIERILKKTISNNDQIEQIRVNVNRVSNPYTVIQEKINKIAQLSKQVNFEPLGKLLKKLYVNDYRNDFIHSNYVIYKGFFNLVKAQKNISLEALMNITSLTAYLFIVIAEKANDEIEKIQTNGSLEYKGKCGSITVSFLPDGTLEQKSAMLCENI